MPTMGKLRYSSCLMKWYVVDLGFVACLNTCIEKAKDNGHKEQTELGMWIMKLLKRKVLDDGFGDSFEIVQ